MSDISVRVENVDNQPEPGGSGCETDPDPRLPPTTARPFVSATQEDGDVSPTSAQRKIPLIVLFPSLDVGRVPINCRIVEVARDDLPTFTIVTRPPGKETGTQVEISVNGKSCFVAQLLVSALEALRYANETRYIFTDAIPMTADELVAVDQNMTYMLPRADHIARWKDPDSENVKSEEDLKLFQVILSTNGLQHYSHFEGRFEQVILAELAPSSSPDAVVDVKSVIANAYNLPPFTVFKSPDGSWRKGHIMIDGDWTHVGNSIEEAFRYLRLNTETRYVLWDMLAGDVKGPTLEALFRKAHYMTSWDNPTIGIGQLRHYEDSDVLDSFKVALVPREPDPESYSLLDILSSPPEIRLLALPPGEDISLATNKCTFEIKNLESARSDSYLVLTFCGPNYSNAIQQGTDHCEIYIGGHPFVVSKALRAGIQQLQSKSNTRWIWLEDVCINLASDMERNTLEHHKRSFIRCAKGGAVILFSPCPQIFPTVNQLGGFHYPKMQKESQQIRLLRFLPPNAFSPRMLNCKLVAKNIAEAPKFTALSYSWGQDETMAIYYTDFLSSEDADNWPHTHNKTSKILPIDFKQRKMQPILINDRIFYILANLEAALRQLKDKAAEQYVWADAICIDQNNVAERAHQVGLMPRIYSSAEQVISWLGEEADGSDLVLKVLKHIGTSSYNFRSGIVPQGLIEVLERNEFAVSFSRLVSRSWWNRLWIYQEAVLAQRLDFCCGEQFLSSETLHAALDRLGELCSSDSSVGRRIEQALGWVVQGNSTWIEHIWSERTARLSLTNRNHKDLVWYLHELSTRSCGDPRDKVYAVLGVADTLPPGITIDYNRSFAEVYAETAKAIIKSKGNLGLLSQCKISSATEDGNGENAFTSHGDTTGLYLPSWAPDWRQPAMGFGSYSLMYGVPNSPATYNASAGVEANFRFASDGITLFTSGISFDTIATNLPAHEAVLDRLRSDPSEGWPDRGDQGWLDDFAAWEQAALGEDASNPSYVGGGTKVEAFTKLLNPFSAFDPSIAEGVYISDPDAVYQEWVDRRNNERSEPSKLAVAMLQKTRQEQHKRKNVHIAFNMGFRLAVGKKGYMGLVMARKMIGRELIGLPKEDDLMCVLRGGQVPFFLRKARNVRNRYHLVSDAYIQGLMDGAVFGSMSRVSSNLPEFPLI